MTMRVLMLLLFSLLGCNTAERPKNLLLPSQRTAPSSDRRDADLPKPALIKGPEFVGVVFPANAKVMRGLYPPGASYWTPSESDVLAAEERLIPFLKESKNPKVPAILNRIGAYKRQYRGVDLNGQKQIFIRFFCVTSSDDWMSDEIVVLDGGSCFFNLRFSTDTKTFSDLWINGEA